MHGTMSSKVSRRNLIKIIAAGGAALAAAPFLSRASAFTRGSSSGTSSQAAGAPTGFAQQSSDKPLVLVVRGDQVLGYRGHEEIPMQDSSFASMLHEKFTSARGNV
jgi:hypothetical protein